MAADFRGAQFWTLKIPHKLTSGPPEEGRKEKEIGKGQKRGGKGQGGTGRETEKRGKMEGRKGSWNRAWGPPAG